MKCLAIILALAATASFASAAVVDTFDTFPGSAGNGWLDGWTTETGGGSAALGTYTASVVSGSPTLGGGNYLQGELSFNRASDNGSNAQINSKLTRSWDSSAVAFDQPHTIQFDVRFDGISSGYDSLNDQWWVTDGLTRNNTNFWSVSLAKSSNNQAEWAYGEAGTVVQKTGVAAVDGEIYTITIDVKPDSSLPTYDLRIVANSSGLPVVDLTAIPGRRNDTIGNFQIFTELRDEDNGDGLAETFVTQIDNLSIGVESEQVEPASVPEPATMAMLGIGGLGLLLSRRRSR